jgi:putative PIN family toxin of toxin-antitoxin system
MIRAVVDTVIFVRGTLSQTGASAFIVQAAKQRLFDLITSKNHLYEIFRTLGYPRIVRKYKITGKIRKRLVSQIASRGILLSPRGGLQLCRDPHDDYLIELALLGKVEYLVTEDDDLHGDPILVEFLTKRNIRCIHAGEFAQILRQDQ